MTKRFIPSRREILKSGGALVVGFSFAGPSGAAPLTRTLPPIPPKTVALTEVDAFLAIDFQGYCTIYSGKVDLGTGTNTALRQIVAEELDIQLDRTRVIAGDTQITPDQGATWGSLTIQLGGMQLRNAAATARQALVEAASRRLGVKIEEMYVADGLITGGGQRVTYGELVGGRALSLKLDHAKPAPAKAFRSYKVVGKSVPREDIPGKVFGTFTYGHLEK
jgi:CO/xanthine dehydrogenase Mo-binding subunit